MDIHNFMSDLIRAARESGHAMLPPEDQPVIPLAVLVIGGKDEAVRWACTPHPLLEDRTPGSLIADGEEDRVRAVLLRQLYFGC